VEPPTSPRTIQGPPEWSWWYEFCSWWVFSAFTVGFSLRTEGWRNLPSCGPVLLIANHQSFLDPLIVGLAVRRQVCSLARKTLFHNRLLARLMTSLNGYPVDHEGIATEGLKTVLQLLESGRCVLLFPEGTRTRDGRIQPLRPGIHLLIKRTQAAIVPVGIAGSFEAWPRGRAIPEMTPLFLPAGNAALAACVGRAIDPKRFLGMAREQVLTELGHELENVQQRAERLRRKP